MARMTGYAPLNKVYGFANGHYAPGALVQYITRCRYATLALMARKGGDLSYKDTPKRLRSRMKALTEMGLVKPMPSLRRYELTVEGWKLLVKSEESYSIANE